MIFYKVVLYFLRQFNPIKPSNYFSDEWVHSHSSFLWCPRSRHGTRSLSSQRMGVWVCPIVLHPTSPSIPLHPPRRPRALRYTSVTDHTRIQKSFLGHSGPLSHLLIYRARLRTTREGRDTLVDYQSRRGSRVCLVRGPVSRPLFLTCHLGLPTHLR